MTKEQMNRAQELCAELPKLRDELLRLGLFRTHHAMDAAVKQIGFELAEIIDREYRI
jgi:hypothetical protein